MKFGTNKTPIEVNKEGAFGGIYFRDIYSGVNSKQYIKSRKDFDELKNIDQNYYAEIILTVMLININLNVKHH